MKFNLSRLLYEKELGTRSYQKINDIPNDFLNQQNKKITKLWKLLESLYSFLNYEALNINQIRQILEDIAFCLNSNDKFKNYFMSLHGHYYIRLILIVNIESKEVQLLTLKIIKLMSPLQEFTQWVMGSDDMVSLIFRLLHNRSLVEDVLKTLNSLFLESSEPFDLKKIQDFYKISNLIINNSKLYLFIRMLFTSCTDFNYHTSEDDDDDSSLEKIIEQKINNLQTIYSINQSIVLGIPNFLKKITLLLKKSTHSDWISPLIRDDENYGIGSNINSDGDLEDLETANYNYRMIYIENISDVLYSLNIETENVDDNDLLKVLKDYTTAECQTEILFILYILLSGTRKSQAIILLNQFNFLDTLILLFKSIDWKKQEYKEDSSPFFAKKMYIIDLLIVWCDIDVVLSMGNLLSLKYEKEIQNNKKQQLLNSAAQDKENKENIENIENIVDLIFKAYKDSFTLEKEHLSISYLMESMVRTWPNQSLQNYFLENKLLESLVEEILTNDIRFMENAFDLFGELIKNNRNSFSILNHYLNAMELSKDNNNENQKQNITEKFFSLFLDNLNSSNVCLRYISISLYSFKNENSLNSNNENYLPYPLEECKVYKFFNNNKVKIFLHLLDMLTPETISAENICCLNTALTFLLLAKKENQCDVFYDALRDTGIEPFPRLDKIKSLFLIWRPFYIYSPEDRIKLEFSSTFSFNHFCECVKEISNL
ncbi:hypothetical protein DICPUDRAFT_97125 [Dictyostelium purpureum]|uniref:Uncharacterized protein n=1 Tax=Dictyostelium purpureum TaxID=5786 RepID=F0ZE34_DICPU|nr:uncharacterized protein DICPUDRAFT_97125 [Dictyostelium purpureum]EGC37817.1 hypothetical protein DICPUDRAFT_97125 [Dictyostelium purpureum]|eukprot:XP_003285662.1 hypothetical protein DICPUDRAFT_97125 [Dictyostelium purpureum]